MKRSSLVRAISLGLWMLAAVPSPARSDEYLAASVTATEGGVQTLSTTVDVPAGKMFEVESFVSAGSYQGELLLGGRLIGLSNSYFTKPADLHSFPKLIGPVQLTIRMSTPAAGYFLEVGDSLILTYRLKDTTPGAGTVQTPATGNAVVIPTDATGPVQIVLESSTDLVTWTAASPGTYGASTTKRFFRVRAVQQ